MHSKIQYLNFLWDTSLSILAHINFEDKFANFILKNIVLITEHSLETTSKKAVAMFFLAVSKHQAEVVSKRNNDDPNFHCHCSECEPIEFMKYDSMINKRKNIVFSNMIKKRTNFFPYTYKSLYYNIKNFGSKLKSTFTV